MATQYEWGPTGKQISLEQGKPQTQNWFAIGLCYAHYMGVHVAKEEGPFNSKGWSEFAGPALSVVFRSLRKNPLKNRFFT